MKGLFVVSVNRSSRLGFLCGSDIVRGLDLASQFFSESRSVSVVSSVSCFLVTFDNADVGSESVAARGFCMVWEVLSEFSNREFFGDVPFFEFVDNCEATCRDFSGRLRSCS